jgi:type I restriction enzyme R subunit
VVFPARCHTLVAKSLPTALTPEEQARESIDAMLMASGWTIQNRADANIDAGRGVAIREFALAHGHGEADYLLFVDGQAAGVVEAKKEGSTLIGVEIQTQKYSEGIPEALPAPRRPLPFLYQSTGIETRFTNLIEPHASSRPTFSFHQPATLSEWLNDELATPGSAFKARLATMPELARFGLWPAQYTAITAFEDSLRHGRRRSLIQMATGSGKTYTACSSIYRLIKFAGARRVLFLVDRGISAARPSKSFRPSARPPIAHTHLRIAHALLFHSRRFLCLRARTCRCSCHFADSLPGQNGVEDRVRLSSGAGAQS